MPFWGKQSPLPAVRTLPQSGLPQGSESCHLVRSCPRRCEELQLSIQPVCLCGGPGLWGRQPCAGAVTNLCNTNYEPLRRWWEGRRGRQGRRGLGFPQLVSSLAPCAGPAGQMRVRDPKKGNPRGLKLPTGEPCIPVGSKMPHIWTYPTCSEDPGYSRLSPYNPESLGLASR